MASVAAIQLQWKRHQSEHPLRDELSRFLRVAHTKGAAVALFPELTGLMVAGPLTADMQGSLRKKGGILSRLFNSLGGSVELSDALPALIAEHSNDLVNRYTSLFGGLAAEYSMIVVGGTLLAQGADGVVQFRAGVFDAEGNLMGWQTKFHLTPDAANIAEPGQTLQTFDAPFGRFGVLVGNDLLFPELARALAFRGCIGILNPTLARSPDSWRKQRLVANARAQENQLFVAQSYLVGTNDIFVGDSGPLMGKSALLAPVELSPRADALLADTGTDRVESVVVGDWNIAALEDLWTSSDIPLRRMVRGPLYQQLLAFDYESGATIAERTSHVEASAPPPAPAPLPQAELPLLPTQADLDRLDPSPLEPSLEEESVVTSPSLPSMAEDEEPLPAAVPAEAEAELPEWMESEPPPVTEERHVPEPVPLYDLPKLPPKPAPPSDNSPTRSVPVIDPDTGKYLGERSS